MTTQDRKVESIYRFVEDGDTEKTPFLYILIISEMAEQIIWPKKDFLCEFNLPGCYPGSSDGRTFII